MIKEDKYISNMSCNSYVYWCSKRFEIEFGLPFTSHMSYSIVYPGINSIESYKKFDFNTLIGEYPKSKIEAFKELQNRFINEIH